MPYSSTMVGINGSPPATPMTAATAPMANPAARPMMARTCPGRPRLWVGPPRWVQTSAVAISTSRPARTLCSVAGPSGCPGGAGPGAREATGKKIDHDQPVRRQLAVGHRNQPRRQRGQHHRQAHRLIQDHRLKGDKAEQADQQRQPKLRTAERPIMPPSSPTAAAPQNAAIGDRRTRSARRT
jgi:hypothetical protein